MPGVNPDILVWARETAGLSLEAAAKAIHLNDTRKSTGADRLAAIERGEVEPSRPQLRKMAEKYRRPLISFYLRQPPPSGERGEDFRRAADSPPLEFNPQLDALIRIVRVRHEVVKSLLEDEEVEPIDFVGARDLRSGISTVAQEIIERIGFDVSEFRRKSNAGAAFNYLRSCMEDVGLFVMLLGDLGSHHSKIKSTSFRGYAIADPIAPFIVINDNDAHAAWSFTALHECTHIWLGQTGVSGHSHEARVEKFCNDVAGHILLPKADIRTLAQLATLSFDEQLQAITNAAEDFNVSRPMVAYQLLRNDTIDGDRYSQLTARFYQDWLHSRAKDPNASDDDRGPSGHVVKRHRLGPALVNLAQRSMQSGALSPVKASQLLGVKTGSLHALLHSKPT